MSTSLKGIRSTGLGTTATAVGGYTAPSVTTGVVVTGLVLTNQSATTITVTCYILASAIQYFLVFTSPVPPGGNLVIADEGNHIVLNSGDQVFAQSSVAASLSVVMSVAEIT